MRTYDIAAGDYKIGHSLPLRQALCSRAVSDRLTTTDAPRVTCSEPCRLAVAARRKKLTATKRATRDTTIAHQVRTMGQTVREVARHHGLPASVIRHILATNPPSATP